MFVLGSLSDPTPNFKFGLEIGGILVAGFTTVSGLQYSRQTTTVAEGGVNDYVHVLPGPLQHGHIKFKRGITFTSFLWEWFHWGMHDADVLRLPIIIINYGSSGLPVKIWPILDAYPVKWEGHELDSGQSEVSVETLEIAFGGRRTGGDNVQRVLDEGSTALSPMTRDSGGGAITGSDQHLDLARTVVKLMKDTLRLERERTGKVGGY